MTECVPFLKVTNLPAEKDSSLWFNVDKVDNIIKNLEEHGIEMSIEPETFYGRKVVSFKDNNGFTIAFSCALDRI